jgi:type VI secretion system VasD/TssJ family lipoprotein
MKLERLVRKAVRLATTLLALVALVLSAGCASMGKSTPKGKLVTIKMTATNRLNNCGRQVPLVLHYRVVQVTDATPLAGMKLENVYDRESEMLGGAFVSRGPDLTIEPGTSRQDAPVQIDPRTRAVVVLGNFCKTRASCFYFAQTVPAKMKKNLALDLTADSTCIGPTPH